MKKHRAQFLTILTLAASLVSANAGTIFYQAIPAQQSDANSGISTDNQYTSAVDGGNTRGTDRVINGITLTALVPNGQTATADNCTVNALSGSLSNAGGGSSSIQADGVLKETLSDMTFNNGATDNSQQEIVLDPQSLEAGTTYDLRIYICNSSGQNRQVNLSFVGDGQAPVETGFFNEDDASTSAGGFKDANQAYYVNYRFTWDGDSTPGVTITQKSGSAPFVLYALTNQPVPGGATTAGAGAAAAGAPGEGQGAGAGQGQAGGGQAGGGQGGEGQAGGEQAGEGQGDQGLSTGLVDQGDDQVGVTSDDFYGSDSLNSNGSWVSVGKWGKCWQPTNVSSGWCPYTNGTFQNCDECGWTFVSDEPWAWACYHYGRWCKVKHGCGWCWVPGKVWAGSWVSWRQGEGESCSCVGWAPLPPEAGCGVGVGVSSWVDYSCGIGPDCYTFINIRDFGSSSYSSCGCIYDHSRNSTIITQTTNCTNICHTGRGTYCGGPDYNKCNETIRKQGGKECGKVYVNRYDNPSKMGGKNSTHQGNQLGLLSPQVKSEKSLKHDPKVAANLKSNQIDHGWNSIKDPKAKSNLKNTIAQQNQGKNPKNTKAVLPSDVAQTMMKKQAGKGLAGQTGGAAGAGGTSGAGGSQGQHPGKGTKAVGAQSLTSGGQAGTSGFNQHPGGKAKGQGTVAGAGAGTGASTGAAGTSGLNQHPGKQKGQKVVGGANANMPVAGGTGAGTGATAGAARHPGQSLKKLQSAQGGTGASGAGTASGVAGGAQGGGGGQHPGKHAAGTGAVTTATQGTTGQTGQGGAGGTGTKGHNKPTSTQTLQAGGQGTQGGTAAAGTAAQGGGGNKGHLKKTVQTGGAGTQGGTAAGGATGGQGSGTGSKTHQKKTQVQTQGTQSGGSGQAQQLQQQKLQQQKLQQQQLQQQRLQQQKLQQQQLQQQRLQQQRLQQQQLQQQRLQQQRVQQQRQQQQQGGGKRPKPTPTPH